MSKKIVYPEAVKWEAIRLREEGFSVQEIQNQLGIKNKSQVYTWWYWYQDGETHRLAQPIGKQYTFGHGPHASSKEDTLRIENDILKRQVEVFKKYKEAERKWFKKFSQNSH